MKIGDYTVYAPFLADDGPSEAEAWGAAVWLWMASPRHYEAPLRALARLLLPLIKQKQYVIALRDNQPCFFLSWGMLSEEAEAAYLRDADESVLYEQLRSGDRLWIFDWITPFGDSRAMASLITTDIFPHHCLRSLYHKGAERGRRVMEFSGAQVSRQQAAEWRAEHPFVLRGKVGRNTQDTEL